jgi:hypothetical protein
MGPTGSHQLTRIVQSGSLCADVVTALSLAMYVPIRVERCRDHRSSSTIFGEYAETPRNAHLRTVNPSAYVYAGSTPATAPATLHLPPCSKAVFDHFDRLQTGLCPQSVRSSVESGCHRVEIVRKKMAVLVERQHRGFVAQ